MSIVWDFCLTVQRLAAMFTQADRRFPRVILGNNCQILCAVLVDCEA